MATKVKKEVEISAKDMATKVLNSLTYKFKQFEGALKSVQNAAGNVARSARGIVTTFGGAAAAAVAAINKMADNADNLQTMANVVGLNVEAYQKLRYAAEQNDVSVESFDKSLQYLSKTMGEMRANTGALNTRLAKTHPALLKQLRAARDNETAFRLMMDAINKAGTAQERAYLATTAFGRSGQSLISLGLIGADAMAEWEKRAESFGLVTSDTAAGADEWGRAMVDARMAAAGLGNVILGKVLPVLTPLIYRLADWVAENKELIADRVIEFGEKLVDVLQKIAAVAIPVVELFSRFSEIVTILFAGKVAGLILNIIKLAGAIKGLVVATGLFNAALWASPITWIVVGVLALGAAVAALIYYWKDIVNWFQKMIDKYPFLRAAIDGIKTAFNFLKDVLSGIWSVIEPIIDGIKWVWNKVGNIFGGKGTLTVEQKNNANNWLADQGLIQTPQYSPASLGQSQANIMTMGGMSHQSADINVRFDNLPPMTRVDTVASDTNLDLEIYRGANGGVI